MRTDRHREWREQLSAYLDGDLSGDAFLDVEAHLAECGACRRVLEELRAVVEAAGALGEIQPPRDLWGGIAATIQAPAPESPRGSKVIALPTAAGRAGAATGGSETGRLALSRPQLAAAAVVLIAASSLATWVAGPGLGAGGTAPPVSSPEGPFVSAATAVDVGPPSGLADELRRLEEALRAVEGDLDPNTVRILERNLGVIERAIEDSRAALAQDPENEFLSEHLDRVYERKLEYLRDAARVVEWSS